MQGAYTVVSQQIETCPVAMILFWGDIFAVMLNICLRETVVTTLILNLFKSYCFETVKSMKTLEVLSSFPFNFLCTHNKGND